MAWFKKVRKPIESANKESRVPEGLWVKCPSCAQIIYNKDLAASLSVCTKCAHHFRLTAAERLRSLFDGSWTEHDTGLRSTDPLRFTDTKPYQKRLETTIASTGMLDAVITATGQIGGRDVVVAAMEYSFIGGSMGVVVGEKITRAIEAADRAPAAGRDRLLLRRRPDDGGCTVADADGQDQRGAGPARPRPPAVHLGPHGSDDGRRHRQLRHAGRREHRGAARADRLRRAAGHRTDHPPEAA